MSVHKMSVIENRFHFAISLTHYKPGLVCKAFPKRLPALLTSRNAESLRDGTDIEAIFGGKKLTDGY